VLAVVSVIPKISSVAEKILKTWKFNSTEELEAVTAQEFHTLELAFHEKILVPGYGSLHFALGSLSTILVSR